MSTGASIRETLVFERRVDTVKKNHSAESHSSENPQFRKATVQNGLSAEMGNVPIVLSSRVKLAICNWLILIVLISTCAPSGGCFLMVFSEVSERSERAEPVTRLEINVISISP